MCFLRKNMKRPIALLAMALVLLSSALDSHLGCHLGFCGENLALRTVAAQVGATASACSHTHGCGSTACGDEESRDETTSANRDHSCPCPISCWCHQSSEPAQLPRNADGPVELVLPLVLLGECGASCAGELNHSQTLAWAIGPFDRPDSSVHRCAELCRFLI